jgi:hypothetical protein
MIQLVLEEFDPDRRLLLLTWSLPLYLEPAECRQVRRSMAEDSSINRPCAIAGVLRVVYLHAASTMFLVSCP